MKKKLFCLIIFFSAVLLISCSREDGSGAPSEMDRFREKNGKLKVLSTIAMINDLVKQVGGEYIDSLTLMRGDLDPHSYQLVKGDDEKLAYADIVFYNGLGLEHGPSLQRFLETHPKSTNLGNYLIQNNPHSILRIDGQVDPHVWMDISLWAQTVPYIVEVLKSKDPVHADTFEANGRQLVEALLQTHQEIKKQLNQIPTDKRYLVTSHDAFNYFVRAYFATEQEIAERTWMKRFAAPEGLAPESQLSASHIQQILDYLKEYRVRVIFPESNVSKDSIRKIVSAGKEKGLDIIIAPCCLYADAMGTPGSDADTCQKMMRHNADWMIKYMQVD